MRCITLFVLLVIFTALLGCGGESQTLPAGKLTPIIPIEIGSQNDALIQYATEFPTSLPQDALQPWEELGSDGKVISATGAASEFFEGPQTHIEAGDTSEWNGALRMASGAVGAGNLSNAMYRIPLGGNEPGVVSVDANLRPMGDGSISGYWVGLSDYGNGSWQWFGPVTDAHWRISVVQAARDGASYLGGAGSLFVCVVAHDGAAIDVVGVGVDQVDIADASAPDAPTNLALTQVTGGIEVNWTAVGGNDVAGYKVYYKDKPFGEFTAHFANSVEGLQGRSFILDAQEKTWVGIRSVDKSGNESLLSVVESAMPLTGDAPKISLDITGYIAMRGEQVSLTASGASLYDWDLDGDGIFDILDDATGTADVNTSQTGVIRPLVRGTGADSFSVACSAISVIVSSNARPVAFAYAGPTSGNAPLPVVFNGIGSTDFDGDIVGGGWDFDGDGIFDDYSTTELTYVTNANHTYLLPGTYNAKLKVVDNEGAWDVDTVTVVVYAVDPGNEPPTAELTANVTSGDAPLVLAFDASGSTDSDGTIVEYAWDWDGDGGYDTFSDNATMNHTYSVAGIFVAKVRVEDYDGARGTATVEITVNVVGNTSPTASLSATPESGDLPLEIDFDAQASNDPDGTIVRYDYDFDGDANYELYDGGDSPDWVYTTAGVFTAHVRVTDDAGAQATDTVEVTITVPGNTSPTADLSVDPSYGDEGMTVTLDASGSGDPDGSIVNYEFDFNGDGFYDASSGTNDTATHAYNNYGVFTAKVRVTDDAGAQATSTVDVRVNEVFNLDHPWGNRGHNDRHTGRSPYIGAQTNSLKWSFTTGGDVTSSPAIGADGTVYVGSLDNKLYALNPDGTQKWSYTTGDDVKSSPAIGAGGTVYVGSWDNKLYALNPDGTQKWVYTTGSVVDSSPAIGADGTVYVGSALDKKLHAINPDGTGKWTYTTGNSVASSPAIGADGTIFVGSFDDKLYAINPDGSLKWSYTTGGWVLSSPAVSADGVVYVGSYDDKLHAINPDGSFSWSYTMGFNVVSSPAIGADGTVYVGCMDDYLYAVNPDGSLKWSYNIGERIYFSSPAIGADGTVYVGSLDNSLHAVNPDGSLKWSYATGDEVVSSPAIGADGTVYIGSNDDKLYAIGVGNSPPTADLTATPPDCNKGETIRYDASGSTDINGTIANYEWDLDNDSVFNETGDEADNQGNSAVEQTYPDVGHNYVTVRVTDNDGATDTASVTITVHGWDTPLTLDSTGFTGEYNSLAVVNGMPAISYYHNSNNDLRYVQASNTDGSAWGTPVTVDSGGNTGRYTSLAVVNGRPAISYYDNSNNALRYVQASNSDGSAWGTPVTVDSAGPTGWYTSLAVVNGMPAISYFDYTNNDLRYVQASNADGSAWGTPVTVDSAGITGAYTSLLVVNGMPAISYYDYTNTYLKYVQASNADGSAWGTPVTVDSAGPTGQFTSLAVVNGMPAISYYDSTNNDLHYVQASNADGSAWDTPVMVDSTGSTGAHTSLVVVNGKPAISYYKISTWDLCYVQASNADGSAWSTPITLDSVGMVGGYTSLAVVNGKPAISYFDLSNWKLKFVRLY